MSGSILKIILILFLNGIVLMVSGQKHIHSYTDDEFITDWLICGPFPSNVSENINTDFLLSGGGESAISPLLGDAYPSN